LGNLLPPEYSAQEQIKQNNSHGGVERGVKKKGMER